MPKSRTWVWLAVIVLFTVQVVQIVIVLHRESLTWDEDDHMYAGYRMWKNGDYGLNPEHPPLVKLLATLPVLGDNLWVPPLKGIFFKGEAYLGGRDWLEHNDGGSQRLVFRMRLAAASTGHCAFAGDLLCRARMVRDNGGAGCLDSGGLRSQHSGALRAGDHRYRGRAVFSGGDLRLLPLRQAADAVASADRRGDGGGFCSPPSTPGILIGPTLLLLIGWEIAFAPKGERGARWRCGWPERSPSLSRSGCWLLWAFYGFRYARAAGRAPVNPIPVGLLSSL